MKTLQMSAGGYVHVSAYDIGSEEEYIDMGCINWHEDKIVDAFIEKQRKLFPCSCCKK